MGHFHGDHGGTPAAGEGGWMKMAESLPVENRTPTPWIRLGWCAGCGLLFFMVYGLCNQWAAWRFASGADLPVWAMAWEARIPLLPWTILPYWSEDLLFAWAFFVLPTMALLRVHVRRIALAIGLSGVFFVAMPLAADFERVSVSGFWGPWFSLLRGMDRPHNLFPSLHVTLGLLILSAMRHRVRGIWRVLLWGWMGLVFASTLTTHQHQAVDVVGGAALGLFILHVLPWEIEPQPSVRAARMAMYYGMPALLLAWLAWWTRPIGLLALWPASALGVVAVRYAGWPVNVYGKNRGVIPWVSCVVMFPVLAGQWLSRCWYACRSDPWNRLASGVVIGRALTVREARRLISTEGVAAVLDLSQEFSAAMPWRSLPYLNLPVMDLTAPTPTQIAAALAWLADQHAASRVVYIHCKAGYSRSGAIAGAWLIHRGIAANAAEAERQLSACRRGMTLRAEARLAMQAFAHSAAAKAQATGST